MVIIYLHRLPCCHIYFTSEEHRMARQARSRQRHKRQKAYPLRKNHRHPRSSSQAIGASLVCKGGQTQAQPPQRAAATRQTLAPRNDANLDSSTAPDQFSPRKGTSGGALSKILATRVRESVGLQVRGADSSDPLAVQLAEYLEASSVVSHHELPGHQRRPSRVAFFGMSRSFITGVRN